MPDLTPREKIRALGLLRQVSIGKADYILTDTVFKLLVVAVTQLESRIIELEMRDVQSP